MNRTLNGKYVTDAQLQAMYPTPTQRERDRHERMHDADDVWQATVYDYLTSPHHLTKCGYVYLGDGTRRARMPHDE